MGQAYPCGLGSAIQFMYLLIHYFPQSVVSFLNSYDCSSHTFFKHVWLYVDPPQHHSSYYYHNTHSIIIIIIIYQFYFPFFIQNVLNILVGLTPVGESNGMCLPSIFGGTHLVIPTWYGWGFIQSNVVCSMKLWWVECIVHLLSLVNFDFVS